MMRRALPAARPLNILAVVLFAAIVGTASAAAFDSVEVADKAAARVVPEAAAIGLYRRALLHGASHNDEAEAATAVNGTADSATTAEPGGERSYTWLKWVAAAVLLVEGLIGVALPALLKITPRATWVLSLLNVFSGGVFLTFGIMHLMPDSLESQDAAGFDRWPLAAFFVLLGFFSFFFLQKVLAPALRLGHNHTDMLVVANATDVPAAKTVDVESASEGSCACGTAAPEKAGRPETGTLLVEGCGCNGDCSRGCGTGCSPDTCPCARAKTATAPPLAPAGQFLTSGAACEPGRRSGIRWEYVSPFLLMMGVLGHTILEGLAIGLQKSYADVVTAFVAMATHKWVESIAVSARFMKAGASVWAIVGFLIPFSLGPLVGIAIGVNVSDSNTWAELVLFAYIAGLFIYIGTCEITSEEFTALERPGGLVGKPRGARFWLFGALFFSFTVVALLQLVHGN